MKSNTGQAAFQETRYEFDLSVVIVSWNTHSRLVECLQALSSPDVGGALTLEVIVVDNASTDGSAEAARRFDGVNVIEAGSNLGYGRANNLGLAVARGRHLLVLNPDTAPLPGSLKRLVESLPQLPRAGIVAPRLLNSDRTLQRSAFMFPTLMMDFLDLFPLPTWVPGRLRVWVAQSRLNGRYAHEPSAVSPFRVDHPLGACLLIRRAAYEECGGFDPGVHMYSEEIDLALRYLHRGWECWQVPSAEVVHYGGESTSRVPDRMYVELWRSRRYLYRKHYDLASRVAQATLLAAAQLFRAFWTLLQLVRGALPRDEASRRWALAGRTLRVVLPL